MRSAEVYAALSTQEKDAIKDFIEVGKYKNTPEAKRLSLRYKLFCYDDPNIDAEKKKAALERIVKEDLRLNFDHTNQFSQDKKIERSAFALENPS